MSVEVASRELRNNTAGLLRRVEAGEEIVITVRGKPVARLEPLRPTRRRPIPRAEMAERLRNRPVDPEFHKLLDELSESTAEDGLDELWREDS
ncbi:MAG: type II toxin-antitoxin system prevent-host-death family antitoxin [Solirubrobacterales bacterium]|nr:type II toxin-antitoxin system prevent-host-death family antitoxin [Solirubrobacterales bacterium]